MPIPAFDANNVLPPHAGDPRRREQLSPFPCTTTEFCQRFATTPERLAILDGFLRFRELLVQAGFVSGFQWVDGSFLEDIEAEANRPPNDLDVVTFYLPPDATFNARVAGRLPCFERPEPDQDDLPAGSLLLGHGRSSGFDRGVDAVLDWFVFAPPRRGLEGDATN